MNLQSLPEFPRDVKQQIFSNFNKEELSKASLVCKEWNELANQEIFWKEIAKEIIGNDTIIPKHKIRKTLNATVVSSNDAIIDKIQCFVKQVTPGKSGRFQCFIRANQKELIPIVLTFMGHNERNEIDEAVDITENVIAINGIGDASLTHIAVRKFMPETFSALSSLYSNNKIEHFLNIGLGSKRNFDAKIQFPNLPNERLDSPLEKKIIEIATKKIDELYLLQHPLHRSF